MSHWQKLEDDSKKDTGTVASHKLFHQVEGMEMNWEMDRIHMVHNHNLEGTCKNHYLRKHPVSQFNKKNLVKNAQRFGISVKL